MNRDHPNQPTATRDDGARTGVWLIGARGSVATTAIAGCAALASGMHPPTGMITETAAFGGCGLPPLSRLVFGGHDTASCPLPKRAEHLVAGGVLPHGLPAAVHAELAAADSCIRPGGPAGPSAEGGGRPRSSETEGGGPPRSSGTEGGGPPRSSGTEGGGPPRSSGTEGEPGEDELIESFAADLAAFTRDNALARTVVVNVASTEGAPDGDDRALPPSSRYAAAALRAGCPYVNFTPSTGLHHPRLREAARRSGLPYAGRDGKTGQTLLRSVLAPMFAQRALSVRAWSGTNLLGGGDGAALADPGAAAAKNAGKERVLADSLGRMPEGRLHIDDVPALGDWKTAWDHVAFDGFLGSRMILQTVWQGCDSALAAPLVLDLARIVARVHECGGGGPVEGLGFYFKDPDSGPGDLPGQWRELLALAGRLRAAA